jgi:hypothetical protein
MSARGCTFPRPNSPCSLWLFSVPSVLNPKTQRRELKESQRGGAAPDRHAGKWTGRQKTAHEFVIQTYCRDISDPLREMPHSVKE